MVNGKLLSTSYIFLYFWLTKDALYAVMLQKIKPKNLAMALYLIPHAFVKFCTEYVDKHLHADDLSQLLGISIISYDFLKSFPLN